MAAARAEIGVRTKPTASWHRYRLALAIVACVWLIGWIAVYGFDYYRLDAAHRALSPMHGRLRPSGPIGRPLGMVAGAMFVLMFLYPLRKRWRWLSKRGRTKHWLDFHIVMGLAAPAIITFHSSFKLQGIAGLAYWIMMSVVVSGIIGRYLYGQIPRRVDAAEMSLQEMQADSARLAEQIGAQHAMAPEEIAALLRLPSAGEVQALPLSRALWLMMIVDLRLFFRLLRLRRKFRGAKDSQVSEVIALVRKQAVLSKRLVFLSRTQQVFHLWHVVHRPFSYSFAILSLLHVAIISLLGY